MICLNKNLDSLNFLDSSKNKKRKIKIFEAFSGIGSQLEALKIVSEQKGFEVQSLGAIDWFVNAIIVYQHFHHSELKKHNLNNSDLLKKLAQYNFSLDSKKLNTSLARSKLLSKNNKLLNCLFDFVSIPNNYTDIKNCSKIPKGIDIFTYSFPCQDLSSQGKQKGLNSGTRSGLLYEVERILKNNQDALPKVLLLENVSNLVSKKFIDKLNEWKKQLFELGYESDYKVLNSCNYGSAQSRKRVFMVSWLDKSKKFNWPEPFKHSKRLKDVIDFSYLNFDKSELFTKLERKPFSLSKGGIEKSIFINYSSFASENMIYSINGFGPTLTASGANSKIKVFIDNKIRHLNSVECGIYMGFDKHKVLDLYNKKLLSDTQLTFVFGNSIPIELLKSIFNSVIDQFFT